MKMTVQPVAKQANASAAAATSSPAYQGLTTMSFVIDNTNLRDRKPLEVGSITVDGVGNEYAGA